MHFAVYRFEGEPGALLAGYERLLHALPADQLLLQVCVQRPDAIEVYDACPTREVFEAFAASAEFDGALRSAGLPHPTVSGLGEASAVVAQGKRIS